MSSTDSITRDIYLFIASGYAIRRCIAGYGGLLLAVVWGSRSWARSFKMRGGGPLVGSVGSYLSRLGGVAIIFLPLMWSAFGAGIVLLNVALGG